MARLDIRTSEEIKDKLQKISGKDRRNMTKELEFLICERHEKLFNKEDK